MTGAVCQKQVKSDHQLIEAILSGDDSFVYKNINNPRLINSFDSKGNTPLHVAIKRNRLKLAQSLVNHGAVFNTPDSNGDSALFLAIDKRDELLIEEMMAQPTFRPNVSDKDGNTPFMRLIQTNSPLINHPALKGTNINTLNKAGLSALVYAVEKKSVALIKQMCASSTLFIPHHNPAPLFYALDKNKPALFRFFVDLGAAPLSGSLEDTLLRKRVSSHPNPLFKQYLEGAGVPSTSNQTAEKTVIQPPQEVQNVQPALPLNTTATARAYGVRFLLTKMRIEPQTAAKALHYKNVSLMAAEYKYAFRESLPMQRVKTSLPEKPLITQNGTLPPPQKPAPEKQDIEALWDIIASHVDVSNNSAYIKVKEEAVLKRKKLSPTAYANEEQDLSGRRDIETIWDIISQHVDISDNAAYRKFKSADSKQETDMGKIRAKVVRYLIKVCHFSPALTAKALHYKGYEEMDNAFRKTFGVKLQGTIQKSPLAGNRKQSAQRG